MAKKKPDPPGPPDPAYRHEPLGRPSVRFYPRLVTAAGALIQGPVQFDRLEAEKWLNQFPADHALVVITMDVASRTVAGTTGPPHA